MNTAILLLNPIIGAVIGYFTNWLAIKMLFRPHNEIRIKGIPLPFTPGLIPKERNTLASVSAKTLKKYLLTEETFMDTLCSDTVVAALDTGLTSVWLKAKSSDKTIEELLMQWFHIDRADIAAIMEKTLRQAVHGAAKRIDEQNVAAVRDYVLDWCEKKAALLSENDNTLADLIDDKWFAQFNNPQLIEKIEPTIRSGLLQLVNHENFDQWVRPVVIRIIDDNISGLAKFFVDADTIYERIKIRSIEFFSDEGNNGAITQLYQNILTSVLRIKVATIVDFMPAKSLDVFTSKLSDWLIVQRDQAATKDSIATWLEFAGSKLADVLLVVKPSTFLSAIEDGHFSSFKKLAKKNYPLLIQKVLPKLLIAMDFQKVMEEKINSFEMAEAEEIILSVVSRELKAITNFGALLGFFIGFLPVLLSLLGVY